jgi:hypothetical protein
MREFRHIPDGTYDKQTLPKIVNSGGMRQYSIGENMFPSITSILSRMMDTESLDAWKERVGQGVANHICQSAIIRGNKFHKICEAYLGNGCICKFENHLLEFGMFEQAKPALERISDIVGIEMPMVSMNLRIGGTADIIAKFDGIDSIIDLKSSTKPKEESWCKRFFLQETAYSMMFEEITSRPIGQLVTIIASENGTVQVLVRSRDDFVHELKEIISQYQSGRVWA